MKPLFIRNSSCAYSLFHAGHCGTNHAAGCYFLCQCRGCSPIAGQPPFDLNHMGTGSDKSDALGVPYYNQHAM